MRFGESFFAQFVVRSWRKAFGLWAWVQRLLKLKAAGVNRFVYEMSPIATLKFVRFREVQ